MPVPGLGLFTRICQPLERVFADGLEQDQPSLRVAADEVVLEERFERGEVRDRDVLGGFRGEGAGEDGQATKGLLFRRREEVVAPRERRSQGLLARGEIPGASGQKRQTLGQPCVEGLERERS